MTQYPQQQSMVGLLLIGIFLLFCLFLAGASVAVFGVFGWSIWFGVATGLLAILALVTLPEGSRDALLALAVLGFFGIPLLHKVSGVALYGYWQVFLFGAALLGIPRFFRAVARSKLLTYCVILFASYLVLGLLSSYLGRSRFVGGAYQFLSDLKPLMLIALGFAVTWGASTERWFWGTVRWFWLFALIFVVAGWAAPGLYRSVFPVPPNLTPDPLGLFPSRALGPFVHPSFLATTSAVFGLLCLIKAVLEEGRRRSYLAIGFAYVVLLFSSVQRQELAAFIAAAAFAYFLARSQHVVQRTLIAVAVLAIGALTFWLVFGEYLAREATSWGFNAVGQIQHPRAQIFQGAIYLASKYFPLGSGFGTFGGAGAMKFDLSLYYELGFRQYWWFGKEEFLMDTYWPNSFAETGVIGAACLATCYLLLWMYAVRQSIVHGPGRLYWIAAASGMIYMLALSFSSPGFQDPRLFLIPALMFGIASNLNGRSKQEVANPRSLIHLRDARVLAANV